MHSAQTAVRFGPNPVGISPIGDKSLPMLYQHQFIRYQVRPLETDLEVKKPLDTQAESDREDGPGRGAHVDFDEVEKRSIGYP